MKTKLIPFVILCLMAAHLSAQDFLGADAVLKKVAEAANAKPDAEKKIDPVAELRQKIQAFEKEAEGLPPKQAATQWLALFDAYVTIPQEVLYNSGGYQERFSMDTLLKALPPSPAWPALAEAIDARAGGEKGLRDGALRLLSAVLRSDGPARQAAVKSMREGIEKDTKMEEHEKESYTFMLDQVSGALGRRAGSPEEQMATFEKSLNERQSSDERVRQRHYGSVEVPDLVQLVGAEKAAPLLKRVLLLDEDASFDGEATRTLAAKIALENIGQVKRAHWALIKKSADMPLYEAMAKKFPKSTSEWERSNADAVYMLNLIAAGRAEDAAKAVVEIVDRTKGGGFSITGEVLESMQRQGLGKEVLAFLREMLARDPALPFWDDFIKLSAQESASAGALEFLETALKNEKLSAASRAEVQSHHANALLAADRVEDGISLLRTLIQAGPRSGAADGEKQADELKQQWSQLGVQLSPEMARQYEARAFGRVDSGMGAHLEQCLRMSRLGTLLERPELVEEGMAAALVARAKIPANESRDSHMEAVVRRLMELKRGPEAEKLILEVLVQAAAPRQDRRSMMGINPSELLGTLAWLYQEAGRPADVVRLLDESPFWGQTDLAGLQTVNAVGTPLTLIAAQALAAMGKTDEARKVVTRTVQDYPGRDGAYALLLSLGGDGLEARLDQFHAADRFEERPLIWKARLQLDAGRVDDAEKTVRAAIAIDPSDGEQGKGDRMRAYAILAEVLEKKGDAEQAGIMRGAVSAIRLSESADDWWQAGLLTRAVKMYEDALKLFADAYCVQSRLALRYSQMGEFEKAEQHYRRAYELMPESFGRVESHCFGCEHIFAGSRAQGLADKIFTELAEKMPDRPQVFYLLGYLREAQARFTEAAEQYRKAIALDPLYLNAWKELAGLSDRIEMPQAECDDIALGILKIDVSGRHSSPDLSSVADLSKLWDAILAAERTLPARETGPLYTLAAAKAEIAKKANNQLEGRFSPPSFFDRRVELRNHFSQHPMINTAGSFLETVNRRQLGAR